MAGENAPQAPRGMGAKFKEIVERNMCGVPGVDAGPPPHPGAQFDVVLALKQMPAVR
jgi:hypothetical protein